MLRRKPDAEVVIYGDEPWEPYDRVKLISLLSGDLAWADLTNLPSLPEKHHVILKSNTRVVSIDRTNHTVLDSNGNRQTYSHLILATGSKAWIPDLPGVDMPGVHTFRNLSDVRDLLESGYEGRRVAVLGGGLLGVELACGLQKKGEKPVVVVSGRLLGRQLDDKAANLLLKHLQSLGIEVIFGRASQIVGASNQDGINCAQAVLTFAQQRIACDCVILATGIIPTTELALSSGLAVGRGIKVNDYLQTSDPLIYAAGECAEHRGRVYGLIGPGFEQADTVAQNVLGKPVKYQGSAVVAQLKGAGFAAFSCTREEVEDELETQSISYESADHSQYRALHLNKGYLTSLICIGEWPEAWRVREAVLEGRRLTPGQVRSFLTTGSPWPEGTGASVINWPKHALVCNCMGVTRGLLDLAIEQGCDSVEALKTTTQAGTNCGSCLPFLAELAGNPDKRPAVAGGTALLTASILALLLLALLFFVPALPPLDTTQGDWHIENLWLKNGWKQVSGYSMLALSCIALLMSLRKRWRVFYYFNYTTWRIIHVTVGTTALLVLMLHCGLSFGHNLNRLLLIDFLLLSLLGAITGNLVLREAGSGSALVRRLKSAGNFGHILLFWPLPVLLTFHILSSYYF